MYTIYWETVVPTPMRQVALCHDAPLKAKKKTAASEPEVFWKLRTSSSSRSLFHQPRDSARSPQQSLSPAFQNDGRPSDGVHGPATSTGRLPYVGKKLTLASRLPACPYTGSRCSRLHGANATFKVSRCCYKEFMTQPNIITVFHKRVSHSAKFGSRSFNWNQLILPKRAVVMCFISVLTSIEHVGLVLWWKMHGPRIQNYLQITCLNRFVSLGVGVRLIILGSIQRIYPVALNPATFHWRTKV